MKELLIDWLQGTFPVKNRVKLFGLVRSCFAGGEFVLNSHGLRYYESSYSHPSGVVVGVGQRLGKYESSDSRDYLELSGRVVGLLSAHRLCWFMRGLKTLEFKSSRIDLTLDDFARSYSPMDAHSAYEAGNISGFRDTGCLTSKGRASSRGLTFSLGNRGRSGSGKFLQFYDKNLESGGQRDCIRCECSYYGDKANQVFQDLASISLNNWPMLIRSYISVVVDFVDRSLSLSGRLDRSVRLDWWANLIEDVIPLCFDPREKDLEILTRIEKWLRHQVAPSLSALFDIYYYVGGEIKFEEFFYEILFNGYDRRNEQLKSLVNSYQVRYGSFTEVLD